MKWSWKIGRFAGIDMYIHATFLLLVGWIGLSSWLETRSLIGTVDALAFLAALFASVALHEYGHALTARRFGIKTRDITLLPIGGVARLERMPDQPLQELWVALAGPAVNVVIAAILFAYLVVSNTFVPFGELTMASGPFFERLLSVNLSLVVFNLLPAFPMDGGRVLRALLALRLEYSRATQIAASIGQGMAFLFGLIGLFTNPFLVFVALFVWIGAQQESSMAQMKSALGGIPVQRAMVTDFQTVHPDDRLERVVQHILNGSQQDFPALVNGQVVGILTRADLLVALGGRGPATIVSEIMRRDFEAIDSAEMLESAFARLQACNCHTVPVMHNQQLVGLLAMENVGEFLMIQSALAGYRARGLAPGR